MKSAYYKSDSKIIRDAVHGDIILDPKFLAIIDTPEFWNYIRFIGEI